MAEKEGVSLNTVLGRIIVAGVLVLVVYVYNYPGSVEPWNVARHILYFIVLSLMVAAASYVYMSLEDDTAEQEIRICPKCRSLNISAFKHTKSWLKRSGPSMGVYSCMDCGYEGAPVILDSMESYGRLLDEKKR